MEKYRYISGKYSNTIDQIRNKNRRQLGNTSTTKTTEREGLE